MTYDLCTDTIEVILLLFFFFFFRTPQDVSTPSSIERSSSITDSGSRSAAVVANIRNRFETPQDSAGATVDSGRGAHGYVEGEMSVISMMRQSSSVKARMAQFSGTGGASANVQRDQGVWH